MKKKSMILSAILVTVLAFTGCGNTQTNTSNTTSDTDGSQQSNEKLLESDRRLQMAHNLSRMQGLHTSWGIWMKN